MKVQRGLFIDFEDFQRSFSDDEKAIKDLNSQLDTQFKLFTFIDIPKEKQAELKYMEKESRKMFYHASLMLAAREREIKRKEMLKELHLGNSIITINYCFDKIAKLICPDLDLNFAKQLFRGAIRPDIVIYQDKESCSYEELFSDYVKFYKVSEDKDNIILNYIDDFCSIYKNIKDHYRNGSDNYKRNFYPDSIGEDLFINWPS